MPVKLRTPLAQSLRQVLNPKHGSVIPQRLASSKAAPATKSAKVIFSGIQPTGVPHLGNYLGALQQWVKLQDEADEDTKLIYSIVDLHALTGSQDAAELRKHKWNTLATLMAIGLNPWRSTIFFQSDVPAHSELMWILSCEASMGYLSRMTQWKSKLDLDENHDPFEASPGKEGNKLELGLFSYPVLQAADILIHRATHVPVGHDQSQHLEFARVCANGFNHRHGQVLVPPSTLLSPAKRIQSLAEPSLKMSKSHLNNKSRILLSDTKNTIEKKMKVAVTDTNGYVSYDPEKRPGVTNLLQIAYHMDPEAASAGSLEEYARQFEGTHLKTFKSKLTDVIDDHLTPIRERYFTFAASQNGELMEAAELGAKKARESADATMKAVRDAVGL